MKGKLTMRFYIKFDNGRFRCQPLEPPRNRVNRFHFNSCVIEGITSCIRLSGSSSLVWYGKLAPLTTLKEKSHRVLRLLAGHSCGPRPPIHLPEKWVFSHSRTTITKCGRASSSRKSNLQPPLEH